MMEGNLFSQDFLLDGIKTTPVWEGPSEAVLDAVIDDRDIVSCIDNGVNVIQNDLESGLSDFGNCSFDFVILSQTLQATRHTEALVREMLCVGREGVVGFPTFGYWKSRFNILQGNMPVSKEWA